MSEPSEPDDVRRTTFVLPLELHKSFRIALARQGTTMQELLEGVVRRFVEKDEAERDV